MSVEINWLAVVLATASSMVIGSIWYSKSVFGKTWAKVLERFFTVHDVAATVKINDFGATPGVVTMRLAQALEVSQDNAILKR